MNKKQRITLIFLLFLYSNCYCQFLNSLNELTALELNTTDKIYKIDSLVFYADSIGYDSLAYLCIEYAHWTNNHDLSKTIKLSEKAKKIATNSNLLDSVLLHRINIDLGYYFSKNYEYSNAISSYKQALDWIDSNNNESIIYEQIANCYSFLKDYFRALENYKIAVSLLDHLESDPENQAILNYSLSLSLSKQNTRESLFKARIYAKKADSICAVYPELQKYRFGVKFHHAEVYNHDSNRDTLLSSKLYREAFNIANNNVDTISMIRTYYGRGSLFCNTNHKKSKDLHFKALELIDNLDSFNLYLNWYALGETLAYEKKYSESSENLIKSILYLTGKDFSDPQSLLKEDILSLKNANRLIHSIPLLGEVYLKWYEETKNKSFLDKSLGYFHITDKIIDNSKSTSKDFLSRLFWRREGTDLYGKALRACYLLEDYDQAFYFMEKNKALLLMEDISQKVLKKSLNNFPQYFQREESLKRDILSVSSLLKKEEERSDKTDLLKQKMDLEIDLSLLQDSIYGYKKTLQHNPTQTKIADVQRNLKKNEVFAEYHVSIDNEHGIYSNNEKGYILFISQKDCHLIEIDQLDELYSDIKKLTVLLKTPLDVQSEIEDYNSLSNKLFLTLFPNNNVRKLLEGKKLTISPDYYLHFLPFEALSTSPDQTQYLINKTEINYIYSYTFGENNINNTISDNNRIIAFAPHSFADQTLVPLSHTKTEIRSIKENFRGDFYESKDALSKTFIDEASNYGIIHLATHAYSSSDEAPWISFYDTKLSLDELYLTENNASLVVLSACNTNIGKLEVGEGVMSLARGFFYGGTQSVVSTLWNVDDKSTSTILDQFYTNLKKGEDKSLALHNAKLTYLENNSHSELSPYYWSSLVLLGDTTPLVLKGSLFKNSNAVIIAVSILLIIIAAMKLFRK